MSTADATLMDHEHGAANNRCSHPDCQAAYTRWSKRYVLEKHNGIPRTVNADKARDHLAKLEGAGWSRRAIAGGADISPAAVSRIAHGQKTIKVAILKQLLALDPATLPSTPHKRSEYVFVPRVGTVRRIQALLALGWTHTHITAASGASTRLLLAQQGRWVARPTHDKIAATYRQLSRRQGPSAITRRRAAALGHLSPAAWDDLDMDVEPDLDEITDADRQVDEIVVQRILAGDNLPVVTLAEKREVVARWPSTGRSLNDLARLTGWKVERYHADLAELDDEELAS